MRDLATNNFKLFMKAKHDPLNEFDRLMKSAEELKAIEAVADHRANPQQA